MGEIKRERWIGSQLMTCAFFAIWIYKRISHNSVYFIMKGSKLHIWTVRMVFHFWKLFGLTPNPISKYSK